MTQPLTEWVDFPDQRPGYEGWNLQIDVSFLASNYHCIWGQGCKGIFQDTPGAILNGGCCQLGAYFGDAQDRARVSEKALQLSEEEWEYHHEAHRKGFIDQRRNKTRVVNGACIFLNRTTPGYIAGAVIETAAGDDLKGEPGQKFTPGCALHIAALNRNESPLDWKPDVCWQEPLTAEEDDEQQITLVTNWNPETWGEEAWNPTSWWCCDDEAAYSNDKPVYIDMEEQLRRMIGDANYEMVKEYLDMRRDRPVPVTFKGFFHRPNVKDGKQPLHPDHPDHEQTVQEHSQS